MKPEIKHISLPRSYYEFAYAILEDDWKKAIEIMRKAGD